MDFAEKIFQLNFPELQLFGLANLFNLYNYHDYLEMYAADKFLMESNITHFTIDKILQI